MELIRRGWKSVGSLHPRLVLECGTGCNHTFYPASTAVAFTWHCSYLLLRGPVTASCPENKEKIYETVNDLFLFARSSRFRSAGSPPPATQIEERPRPGRWNFIVFVWRVHGAWPTFRIPESNELPTAGRPPGRAAKFSSSMARVFNARSRRASGARMNVLCGSRGNHFQGEDYDVDLRQARVTRDLPDLYSKRVRGAFEVSVGLQSRK